MKTMKVNVTFQLEVPIRTDSAGRRLSITDQISPYVSDYFADLQTTMKVEKHHNYGPCKRCDVFNYDAQTDYDIFEKVDQAFKCYHSGVSPDHPESSRIAWEAEKNAECMRLFKMSWADVKQLSWTQQADLRKTHGVIWQDGKWVKKGD